MTSYSKNKKAYHDYEILEEFEAGIALNGDEVKAIKESQANLKGAFIDVTNDEAFLNEAHVSRYKNSARKEHDPTRKRKLLLQKKQIHKIEKEISQKGVTAVPLELYSKGGLIKLKLGICRGKKLHDKREVLKKRSQEKEIRQQVKQAY
ncbi:SsrA-binding protein [Candidatus Peregrinibacteria bacterium CG10_big_fil_rev_8_21_14_0_10_36_19]|nr:MAG: SsrA-binding protein [Candidatus Peregrinibacteria bacterium CG10_big_fil_rev_8_21_14_0_10_36_19]